jgi:hypothetical protein
MSGLDNGILPLALRCLDVAHGATDVATEDAELPRDLLYEARTGLRAVATLARDDKDGMRARYAELLPAAGELAGAGSGLLTLRPVAQYLGDLAMALGRADAAADHYRQAMTLAERAGAPDWAAAARAGMVAAQRLHA